MDIKISEPVYIHGVFNNIPLKNTWIEGLIEGIGSLKNTLSELPVNTEILSIEVDRDENFKELNASGSIGYVIASDVNSDDGYYYVDFRVEVDELSDSLGEKANYYYSELLKALIIRVQGSSKATISKTECSVSVSNDAKVEMKLRGFFITNT